tara:strand:+ start:2645 stop:3151 length:507 start_codon:yes stop_codon:yes gene_type:complete
MQSTVYFSLGSNLGDRYSNLSECVSLIENNVGEIKSLSSIYKNSAQGFIGDYFYNCCVKVSTSYKTHELIDIILSIENTMGRKIRNTQKYASRKIDIDIILYDDLIIEEKNLTIPHPRYTQRSFVLVPLLEIDNKLVDPKTKTLISEFLSRVSSKEKLEKIKFSYLKV